MKIVVEEARAFVNADKSGIGKFYLNTMDILKKMGYNPIHFEKEFLVKTNPFIRRLLYFIWLNTVFLYKLWKLHDDVAVIGVNYYIPFFKIPRIKYYPVVHDIMSTKKYPADDNWKAFVGSFIKWNAIKNAEKVITVSETSRQEISEYYSFPLNKICNVYNGFSLNKHINVDEHEVLNKYSINSANYILSVSSLAKHKNIKTLIEAFNKIKDKYTDLQLVLVGKGQCFKDYSKNNFERIIFTGFIEEEELKVLYKNAKMYAFPSLVEGFGIPIIDAQNFELPVICTDIPIFKEIAGEGAIFFNKTEEGLSSAIGQIVNNPALTSDLISKGIKNIERFSEENRIQLWKDVIRKVVE